MYLNCSYMQFLLLADTAQLVQGFSMCIQLLCQLRHQKLLCHPFVSLLMLKLLTTMHLPDVVLIDALPCRNLVVSGQDFVRLLKNAQKLRQLIDLLFRCAFS